MSYMSSEERQEEERRLAILLEDARGKIREVEENPLFAYTREFTSGKLRAAVIILDTVIAELRW